jgi:hypothetical protein
MKRPLIARAFGFALASVNSVSAADLAKQSAPPDPAKTLAACEKTKESAP